MMRLRKLRRLMKRRSEAELTIDAYVAWRQECAAVKAAYVTWRRAGASEAARAFDAYEMALDREERAAKAYAELIGRVGHMAELALARLLAYPTVAPGA